MSDIRQRLVDITSFLRDHVVTSASPRDNGFAPTLAQLIDAAEEELAQSAPRAQVADVPLGTHLWFNVSDTKSVPAVYLSYDKDKGHTIVTPDDATVYTLPVSTESLTIIDAYAPVDFTPSEPAKDMHLFTEADYTLAPEGTVVKANEDFDGAAGDFTFSSGKWVDDHGVLVPLSHMNHVPRLVVSLGTISPVEHPAQ